MRRGATLTATLLVASLLGAGSAAAAQAARNGLVAFESNPQFGSFGVVRPGIHAVDPVTGSRRVIKEARADGWLTQPAWSPDGTRIAYVVEWAAEGRLQRDIEVAQADGSAAVRLTNTHDAFAPAWSPDGSIIAFHTFHRYDAPVPVDRVVVEMIRPDGSGRKPVTVGWVEHWRPDCARLLVQRTSPDVGHDVAPVALGPYGRDRGAGRASLGAGVSDVTWSPDARRIAFGRSEDGGTRSLFVSDPDGRNPRKVNSDGYWPAWSPEGTQLVFTVYGHNLEVVSVRGGRSRAITHDGPAFRNHTPAWQPLPGRPLDQRLCRSWRRALWGRRSAG